MNPAPKRPSLQYVVLETTRRCNLRCVHCAVSEENNLGNYDARDLPIQLFHKLLPMLRDFKPTVQLSGHGETFLHSNFMEMLEEVRRAGCEVTFQTNGTILTARHAERIVRAGVNWIVISIDAASAELFEKIRRRARLDKIVENIRLINETKKRFRKDRPQLGFEFVAMRQNIHELPAVMRMAGELGVANFQVAELAEYNLTRGQSLANDPLMAEWVPKAEVEAQKWGINLTLPPNIPGRQVAGLGSSAPVIDPGNPATYKGLQKTCREPWEKMFVQFSGEVRPCCVIGESYGDLSVQGFEEVWSGRKYQALRAALLTDEPFAVCVRCPFYGWEPIDSLQPTAPFVGAASRVSAAGPPAAGAKNTIPEGVRRTSRQTESVPFFRRAWRRLVRKLAGPPDYTVQLSDEHLIWLLNRLNSPNPQAEVDQIREGIQSLPESCLALLENGEPLSDKAFVERAYASILGREPDEQGFYGHLQALRSEHASRTQVVASFLSSTEFQRLLLRS
jgi:MoaA/NifB/PqqE/SkfB family radical SAM enzyme